MTSDKKPIRIDYSDGKLGLVLNEKFFEMISDGHTEKIVMQLADIADARDQKLRTATGEKNIIQIHKDYSKDVLALTVPSLKYDEEANNQKIGLQMLNVAGGLIYTFLVINGGQVTHSYFESLQSKTL
jgi:hypothetical protein